MEPYKFKKIIFNNGLLNDSVDATYIIHLENNGRYEHIQKQLLTYHPTNILYILFNKGYKKSNKKPFIKNATADLVDAFLTIFKHANDEKYNNILILEDDFIFSENILKYYYNINNSVNKLGDTNFLYLLGCIPFIQIPFDLYNNRVLSCGMHAVIYSYKNRINTLNIDQETINDWDCLNNQKLNRFTYHLPLCYQLFPITDNSKTWGGESNNFIMNLLSKVLFKLLKFVNLDVNVEPGTSFFYNISSILFYILIFIIIFTIKYFYLENNK